MPGWSKLIAPESVYQEFGDWYFVRLSVHIRQAAIPIPSVRSPTLE